MPGAFARLIEDYHFFYNDKNVTVGDVRSRRAMKIELAGLGKQLGYRAMRNKIRQLYELSFPRSLLYDVIYHLDPQRTERTSSWWRKRGEKLILSLEDLTRYIL